MIALALPMAVPSKFRDRRVISRMWRHSTSSGTRFEPTDC
jgi:hypothetical protein